MLKTQVSHPFAFQTGRYRVRGDLFVKGCNKVFWRMWNAPLTVHTNPEQAEETEAKELQNIEMVKEQLLRRAAWIRTKSHK
jgi:hypothetical protein